MDTPAYPITTIALPTRLQPDTLVAIELLRQFGISRFPGILTAAIHIRPDVSKKTEQEYLQEGVLLLDVGGGRLDHHTKSIRTTASELVARELGIIQLTAIAKLLAFAKRDDFYGKGTISDDVLDKTFGLAGLISAVNKQYPEQPEQVAKIILPVIHAHLLGEIEQSDVLPYEVSQLRKEHKTIESIVKQNHKKLKVIMVQSDNQRLAGFLRSVAGGGYDVVLQQRSTMHTNIMTRDLKRIDLRVLIGFIRWKEVQKTGVAPGPLHTYMKTGRIENVPAWYYDPATNSLLNGGAALASVPATTISWEEWHDILITGLAGFNELQKYLTHMHLEEKHLPPVRNPNLSS